jgi:hypothetical protein
VSLVALLVIGFTGYRNFRHWYVARQQDLLQQQGSACWKRSITRRNDVMLKAQEEEELDGKRSA